MNAAEFVVTCAVVSAFAATIFFGVWEESKGISEHLTAILGLILGGVPAALFAGWLLKVAPRKPLMIAVGLLILGIAGYELSKTIF